MASKKYRKRQLGKTVMRNSAGSQETAQAREKPIARNDLSSVPTHVVIAIAAVLLPVTVWAYWPTLVWMEDQWRNEPDYSHGYLVIPFAIGLLYMRSEFFPGLGGRVSWIGFLMLLLAIAGRLVGRMAYMDFLDGWTLVLWVGGIVWILCGWQVFRWALPAVLFLFLLVPLPYQAESLLSWRLQGLATLLSVGALQIMNFPAISEGHTIWLNDHQMMVEEACSGLRIFVGMGAMAYVVAVLSRRAWIDRLVILSSAIPIAILVNAIRVACTVLAYHWLSESHAKKAHDYFGIVMIVLGLIFLAAVKLYWERLYRPVEVSMDLRGLAADS